MLRFNKDFVLENAVKITTNNSATTGVWDNFGFDRSHVLYSLNHNTEAMVPLAAVVLSTMDA